MSFKIAFIGAGSIGFTRGLLRDILAVKEFNNIEVAFTDINEHNLEMVTQLCQRDIDENGLKIKIQATADRREAVKNARYVFNVVRIGGIETYQYDIDIPLKYGVDQCVEDTLCAGGIMYGQRGIVAILDFCKDIREVAEPGCLLLNYAKPNAMVTWACNKYGKVRTIGLCHGVQHGHEQIANVFGLKKEEVDIICAGINHQTWYIQVRHNGEDLTGKLLEAFQTHPEYSVTEKVRIDMLKRFGYYSTESNGHLRVTTEGRNWFETAFPNWMKEPAFEYKEELRSKEHGSYIVEGLETGRIYRGHFNVVNNGAISNLPDDAIVEVPGYVDANGINVPRVGDLPLGCAAVCNASISVQRMSVEAAVSGDDKLLRQAMMLDPLVGAVCNTNEIWQMTDEMLVAQKQWLPQYGKAIAEAEERLKSGSLIPVKEGYKGAARLHTKTVEEMAQDREAAKRNAGAADKAEDRPAEKK